MVYHFSKKKGFSLLEVIIVIGIFVAFISISSLGYINFKSGNNLDIATQSIVEALRHAQNNAENSKQDSNWGVKITDQNVLIFSGNSYASRDTNFDLNLDLPKAVSISGDDEIIFDKITGNTNTNLSITVSVGDQNNLINLNEKGVIEY